MYAASEGLSVIVLDSRAFGGQAGASSRIENYLGFPTGISGMALMARAYNQAQKFGVEMVIPDQVNRLADRADGRGPHYVLGVGDDETVQARTVVIASGADYRRLDLSNVMQFEGSSIHYWASPIEARLCGGRDVALVGAGNSAGQAAVYLAGHVSKVWVLARGRSLEASMSQYLVERIKAQANIEVLTQTEVTALEGSEGTLAQVRWRTGDSGEIARSIGHLFLFIGAAPNTNWLAESGVALDAKGFVHTGRDWEGQYALERIEGASLPSATCAPVRSSASPLPLEKARRSSPPSMLISRRSERPLHRLRLRGAREFCSLKGKPRSPSRRSPGIGCCDRP